MAKGFTHAYCAQRDKALVDLIHEHRGKENAISTRHIVREMSNKGYDTSYDAVPVLIRHVTQIKKVPICSAKGYGYYWAESNEDIYDCITELEKKISGLQKRIDFLKKYIHE